VQLLVVPVRTFLLFKSRDEILFKGEGCDSPSVTVVAIMFLHYPDSVIRSATWFKLKFKFESYP
jgi:hypothetical protein